MKPDPANASQALQNAQQAMQRGDRPSARRWAEMAAALAPELEEPWLILAALASPRSSVSYLERALRINPDSRRAQEGMRWAVERLRQGEGKPRTRPQGETQPRRPLSGRWTRDRTTRPMQVGTSQPTAPSTASAPPPPPITLPLTPPPGDSPQRLLIKYRRSFTSLLLVVACLAIAWAVWPGNALPALALLRQNILPQSSPTAPGAPADVAKPTYTPSASATFTPTTTYTPTATFTLTATPTDTPIPTSTFTPWPTNTRLPQPTLDQYSFPGDLSGGTGERWIDVDLSQQRLYAYEGNTIVASFLVSTGVWQYPTVVGKFHIYVKYLYADMAGVGYYLPNVPYTMYFYKGYSIHGTYWHNNFGHPMSHGCINMYTPDAAWMFNWASVGTLVSIHY